MFCRRAVTRLAVAGALLTLAAAPLWGQSPPSTRVDEGTKLSATVTHGYPYRECSDYVLKELDLRPGDVAVDIGAGDGWWSEKMAQAVGPKGVVHAAEVDRKAVERLKQKYAALPQLQPYLCKPDDLELPAHACDVAFFSQVYHHLPRDGRVDYLRKLHQALKPTGRVCIIEKYPEIATQGKDHGTQLSALLGEAEQADWIPVRCELMRNTGHYLAIFVAKEILLPPAAAPTSAELRAGAAAVEITPPVGYRLSGYFYERPSTGVHDPLMAKALVFKQGDVQAAIVCCDLIGVPWSLTQQVRARVMEKTGIRGENVLVAATHTHTGPLYFGELRKHFHAQSVAAGGSDARETVDYTALLVDKLTAAVAAASSAARPTTLAAGVARQEGLSFNRRFLMKDGSVRFNPGKLNPEIVRPAGPIDPDAAVVLLRDAAGRKPLAALTVFALHLDTVGGTEYGADFPYYLGQVLQKRFGGGFVSIFGNGTCGDINHVDVSQKTTQHGPAEAQRIGEALAATVQAEIGKLDRPQPASLAVRSTTVDVALQQPTSDELAWAAANEAQIGQRKLPFLEEVKLCKILDLKARGAKSIALPVQVFRLSDETAVVGLPGEVFVDLGLAIKHGSPFRQTLVIELCNDAPAYVPTQKAFVEGSYETVNSRVAPGGGEQLVAAALKLLKQLK